MYSHSKKAGNIGDVFKHMVLMEVLSHVVEEKANSHSKNYKFGYCETHCGAPEHNLNPGGEWENGIGRVFNSTQNLQQNSSLYLQYINSLNKVTSYLSSWKLARTVLDKVPSLSMLLCDNSPDVAKFLKPISDRDAIFDYHCGDGYKYVKSLSTQKLDFVFIDPPYKTDKSEKVSRDWAEVIKLAEYLKSKEVPFVVWYPIFTDKNPKMLQAKLGLPCLELLDNSFVTDDGLVGNNRQLKGAGMLFGGISESYIKSLTKLLNTELFVFGEVTFKN